MMKSFPRYLQYDAMDCGPTCLRMIAKYLFPYRKEFVQLLLGMLVGTLLQLVFPFLTQSLVDVGTRDGNLSFITLILVAQLVVSVSQLSVEFIRSWILLHVNTRINISLISDFLIKLLKLILGFYEPNKGDIRMGDTPIGLINPHLWRAKSGAVMQDGFIFSTR